MEQKNTRINPLDPQGPHLIAGSHSGGGAGGGGAVEADAAVGHGALGAAAGDSGGPPEGEVLVQPQRRVLGPHHHGGGGVVRGLRRMSCGAPEAAERPGMRSLVSTRRKENAVPPGW